MENAMRKSVVMLVVLLVGIAVVNWGQAPTQQAGMLNLTNFWQQANYFKNLERIRFADSFAQGSSTGGIAEAIADLNGPGMVVLPNGTVTLTQPLVVTQPSLTLKGQGFQSCVAATANCPFTAATILRWGGAANGTVVQFKGTVDSKLMDTLIDCNGTGGIGLDVIGGNNHSPVFHVSVSNTFDHVSISNCAGTPGYLIHHGTADNSQASNNFFRKIRFNGPATNGFYQEGTQTQFWMDDMNAPASSGTYNIPNEFNIRAGWGSVNDWTGGGSPTSFRLTETILEFYMRDMEFESQCCGVGHQFLVMEDGPGNGNNGPLVRVDQSRLSCQDTTANYNVVQWGVSSGSGGYFTISNTKLDSFVPTFGCTVALKSPSGTPLFFTNLANTWLTGTGGNLVSIVQSGTAFNELDLGPVPNNGAFGVKINGSRPLMRGYMSALQTVWAASYSAIWPTTPVPITITDVTAVTNGTSWGGCSTFPNVTLGQTGNTIAITLNSSTISLTNQTLNIAAGTNVTLQETNAPVGCIGTPVSTQWEIQYQAAAQ
jgi:hypothetical protein